MTRYLDPGSFVVAIVTMVLFIAALFAKGITHDLFLEAGVFLISMKIILLTYRNSVTAARLERKIDILLGSVDVPDHLPGNLPQSGNEP